jgi:adenosylcobinamide kinase/adenosylcobinamide-phosphate guanylyltransferase
MAGPICLTLGGVRSGKSAFAENLAREQNRPTLYLATGQASDAEMTERIRRHRERRPADWQTLEESLNLAEALAKALAVSNPPPVVLIDSLDGWVSNLILQHESEDFKQVESLALDAVDRLLKTCATTETALFLVSSEVGLSLVPPYPLGRRFQDLLGLVNQKVAAAADRAYLVVAGIPMVVKGDSKI